MNHQLPSIVLAGNCVKPVSNFGADGWIKKIYRTTTRDAAKRIAAHYLLNDVYYVCIVKIKFMTERELRKLEGTIRTKMEDVRSRRVSLKDSGVGGLMNTLKKTDEALYEKILPEYKRMVADYNIFK